MSSCTNLIKHKVTHKWMITDFEEYLDDYTHLHSNSKLHSALFYTNNHKYSFSLSLTVFNSTNQSDALNRYLSYNVEYGKCEQAVKMCINLYILNSFDKKYQEVKHIIVPKTDGDSVGMIKFCAKNYLWQESSHLLPNNTLTLGCDVTVYELSSNDSLKYKQSPLISLEEQLKELLDSQTNFDFKFIVKGEIFKVHKFIIRMFSPEFAAIFQKEMKTNTNQATVTDVSPEIFKKMLEYIYTKQVADDGLDNDEIIQLLAAADKYKLEGLKDICGELLSEMVKVENVLEILSVAESHKAEKLITFIKEYINCNKEPFLKAVDIDDLIKNPGNLGNISKKAKLSD